MSLVLLAACAPVRTLIAPHAEYAAYRPTRTAVSLDERLEKAREYLDRYPEGTFAPEVRAFLDRGEAAFYAAHADSIDGLEVYLRAMPTGAHAAAARERLAQLRARKAEREETGVATIAEAKHVAQEHSRARIREVFAHWIDALLDPAPWQGPLLEAPRELIVPWSLSLPSPSCAPMEPPEDGAVTRCKKTLDLAFSLPGSGRT
jgi:hypothetical protein